jgi:septum formation protein
MDLILASASPRRREMLELMGYDFSVKPSRAEENIEICEPGEYVSRLAKIKASAVARDNPGCCVLGSDTIVYLDGEILGKPHDEEDAFRILSKLSGRTHTVYTGVAVIREGKETVFYDRADVTFKKLEEAEIRDYIATGEPMDKAGAYGIQGPATVLVEKIDGCYFTVIGLPSPHVYEALKEMGILPRWRRH